LKKVSFFKKKKIHPFCIGLVVNKIGGSVIIAAQGGLIKSKQVFNTKNEEIIDKIKIGSRMQTPIKIIEKSITRKPIF